MGLNNIITEMSPNYLVFFDNVRVDHLVKDYSVNLYTDGEMGVANLNMVYIADLDKILHQELLSQVQTVSDKTTITTASSGGTVSNTGVVYNVSSKLLARNGPGKNYGVIGWMWPNERMTINSEQNGWYNVTYKIDGTTRTKTGWASADYIRRDSSSGGGTAQKYTGMGTSFNIKTWLNVRTGPSMSNALMGKIFNNERVTINQEQGEWMNVTYDTAKGKKTGWVHGQYIRKETVSVPAQVATSVSQTTQGLTLSIEDGIENMTNLRIFEQNVFSGGYIQVFEGNIRSKSVSIQGDTCTLSFQAYDYMNWFNRTICPIAIPLDQRMAEGDRLKWRAQGIDLSKVKQVATAKDVSFKGQNLSQMWMRISSQTMSANKLFSNSESVAMWDNVLSRVAIMGDIDENLRKAEVMDFMVSTSITSVNTIYVLLNDVLKTLLFEFYQDRDGVIRIKPPFWNEHVLRNHVIDPSLIMSFASSTNWNNSYTRIITSGGVDEYLQDAASSDNVTKSIITPVAVYTSNGIEATSGPVVIETPNSGGGSNSGGSSKQQEVVNAARKYLGVPYAWGGTSFSGIDCSGLTQAAYRAVGISIPRVTYDQVKCGVSVSKSDLQPGDLIFCNYDSRGPGHVTMYTGNGNQIQAPRPGKSVYEGPLGEVVECRRIITDGSSSGSSTPPATYNPDPVGPDELLNPTDFEKKYGPLIYDNTQSLVKFSTSSAIDNSKNAYDALIKYSKFMMSLMNSSVEMANVQVMGMPWLRPGFNVWIDPTRIDKVYYVNSITRYGSASAGCYANLNLVMGRHREKFVNNSVTIGGLRSGATDNVFINTLYVKPENFGPVCDYGKVKDMASVFHTSPDGDNTKFIKDIRRDPYYNYLYVDSINSRTNFPEQQMVIKSPAPTVQQTGVVHVNTWLAARSAPSTSATLIGKVWNNDKVTILEEKPDWMRVTYPLDKGGTKTGWVHSAYVKKDNNAVEGSVIQQGVNYRAYANPGTMDMQYSINEIVNDLNAKYASAPAVIKARASRLASIIDIAFKIQNGRSIFMEDR